MKRAFVKITPPFISMFCKSTKGGEKFSVKSELPEDAKFISMHLDPVDDSLHILFEHDSFENIPGGYMYPFHSFPSIIKHFENRKNRRG